MDLKTLKEQLDGKSIPSQIEELCRIFPGSVLFTTSFGIEDQVISHLIFSNNLPVRVATLDTGRLFPETYKVFNETIRKYQKPIQTYFPDYHDVEKMVEAKGPLSFYLSKENRLECCRIRKVVPLNRALQGVSIWISGIRASQSEGRKKMDWLEYDEDRKIYKYYPIFDWQYDDLTRFVRDNQVPYNVLHDKGFVSIGCQPCTRAVEPGQDFRAGRWWWENGGEKECGVHIK